MSVDDRLRAGFAGNAATFQPAVESDLAKVRARGRRRRTTRGAVAAALVAVAAAVGAVVVGEAPDDPPPVTPATTPTADLFGRYQADVRQPGPVAGRWALEFEGNGTVQVSPPEGYSGVVSGTLFTADATTLRTNLFLQDLCAGLGSGEFSWTREGDLLVLAAEDEPCAPRGRFFTGNDWIEVSGP